MEALDELLESEVPIITSHLSEVLTFCLEVSLGTASVGGPDSKEIACNAGDPGSIPGREDPLEKGMAAHFSIFVWEIP